MAENPKRRWQFSLRTLLVAVALLAFPSAWVGYQLNWIRERNRLRASPNVSVHITWPYHSYPGMNAPWQLRAFGETGVSLVVLHDSASVVVEEVQRLYPEAYVFQYRGNDMTWHMPLKEEDQIPQY
jgi:hypothetical protein